MTPNSSDYFVRLDRHVRGPFSRDVLASMFDRGRITPETQVSPDRNYWVELRTLGEPFASGGVLLEELAVHSDVPLSPSGGDQYFCTIEGETQGPLRLHALQHLVAAGRLEPNDQVWQQGQSEWMAASDVPGLAFVSQPELARSWIRTHRALFVSLVFMAVALFTLPTYYVLASAAARRAERIAQEELRKEQEQREQEHTELNEKIAREERHFNYQVNLQKMQHEEEMAHLEAGNRDTQAIERRHQEEQTQRQRQHNEQIELLQQQIEALKKQ